MAWGAFQSKFCFPSQEYKPAYVLKIASSIFLIIRTKNYIAGTWYFHSQVLESLTNELVARVVCTCVCALTSEFKDCGFYRSGLISYPQ